MRALLRILAFAGIACVTPPDVLRGALATASSALIEATPFLFGAALLSRFGGARAMAYVGCGCGLGPAARSLPGTAAAWLTLGPFVALARFGAAIVVARAIRRRRTARDAGAEAPCAADHAHAHVLLQLAELLPAAAVAAVAMQLFARIGVPHAGTVAGFAAGAAFAFVTSPCALGVVAIAGALHAGAPASAAGFLCVAGIADARALGALRTRVSRDEHHAFAHDICGYAMLAAALAIVAARHGDALIHPAATPFAALSCIGALALAIVYRRRRGGGGLWIAPAVMVAGALCAVPPPPYRATETTLGDLFPGERVSFTGTLVRDGSASALVRYSIVCCRADATPIVVRLARTPPFPAGTWLHADGTIEASGTALRLAVAQTAAVAPPDDPFVYR